MSTSYALLRDSVLLLYAPGIRRKATRAKMAQVLDEFGALVETTDQLTPTTIALWLASCPSRSPLTAFTLLRTMRSAVRAGIALGLVERDPFAFRSPRDWFPAGALNPPDRPRHHPAEAVRRVLDRADAEAEAAGTRLEASWKARRLRALVYLAAYTGARRNELLGLEVVDIDLPGRIVHIRPNAARPLKTASSRAELPLAEPAALRLARWIPRTGSAWLFPQVRNRGPWMTGLQGYRPCDQLVALGECAGVEGFTFQALRHSVTMALVGSGAGQVAVKEVLRHSSVATQRHYIHHDLGILRETIGRLPF